MNFDYYLKFEDEAQAMSVLYRKEGVTEEYEGYDVPNFDNIDIIGTIYEPTVDEETPPVAIDGFHVNVRNYTETNELDSYLVFPTNPRRIWAGDNV